MLSPGCSIRAPITVLKKNFPPPGGNPLHYLAKRWSVHTEDGALIKACLRRDRVAEERFYQKYFPDAYRTCNRYLSQQTDVMSVVNAGFLKVFQHLDQYDARLGAPGAWIHRIMVHTALDHIRQERRRPAEMPLDDGQQPVMAVENQALAQMHAEALLRVVKHLPVTTRAVFNMSVMEGYSHSEIAGMLGVTESTSRWHLAEAKQRLRRMLGNKAKLVFA